jgi:SAM-dependent methyltransferase
MSTQTKGAFEQEYYDTYYRNYTLQNPPRKLGFYRRVFESAAKGIARPKVLELGCAFGRVLSVLDPEWDRYGLDISEYAIGQARESIPDARFCVSSATEIPFDETFDIIAAFDLCEHVPDLGQLAGAIKSKLKPSGKLFFVVPVYDGVTGPIIRALDKDVTHVHKTSRRFWLDWASSNFKVVEWWGIYRYLFPTGYYLHTPTKTLRKHTPAIAVLATTAEA